MFQFDKCCRPSGESKSDRKLRSRYLRNAPYKKERKNDINLRRSINNDDIEIYSTNKQTNHTHKNTNKKLCEDHRGKKTHKRSMWLFFFSFLSANRHDKHDDYPI